MRKNLLVFGQPQIEENEINEVIDSMKKCWLGTGPKVKQFETDFRDYKNVPYSAAVNSCTAALHLSFIALDIKFGDEVIAPAMTFCASINTIIHTGGKPVLADINPITLNIDPKDIEHRITPRTKAILVVHFAGRPCDMEAIMALSEKYNLPVIEDCAHAIETTYKGKHVGTFGDTGCFSFYSTKNVVTGEGGMVITHKKSLIDRIKIMSLHGLSADAWERFSDKGYEHYYVEAAGFKYNMMDLQAAIGIHQLRKVDRNWRKREKVWKAYTKAFRNSRIDLPAPIDKSHKHAYHLFTIRICKEKTGISRDDFLVKMKENNIGVGVHYLSIPEHPYYKETYKWKSKDFPVSRAFGKETVSLPLSPKLTDEDINDVIQAVNRITK